MGLLQACPRDDYSNWSCCSPSKVAVVCQEAKGMRVKDKEQFVSMQEDKKKYMLKDFILGSRGY